MRPLEILILVMLFSIMMGFLFPRSRRPGWLRILPWLALALTLVHLVVEKYRWQMAPAYVVVVLSCLLALGKGAGRAAKASRWRTAGRMAGAVVAGLVCAGTAFLAGSVPVFRYPAPSGPLRVGSTRLYFVDSSRRDTFAPNPHAPRELLVVAWYPADVAPGAQPESFWPAASVAGPVLARTVGIPFLNPLGHLRLVRSHSYADAPVARAQAQYPVLIFSHGYAGSPWQNTVQMEELASHGFMVFSVGHTYESVAIPFPDGRVVPISPELVKLVMPRHRQMDSFMQELRKAAPLDRSLGIWVADTQYLMDELAKINAGAGAGATEPGRRFAQRLDLARLGVFGMSSGGATAGQVCARDPRCKAGLNMDGFQRGDLVDHPLAVPFLYFAREGDRVNDPIYAHSRGDLYRVQVNRSTHFNFADLSLVLPILRNTPVLGSIDGPQIERIMNAYTLAFFQKYLQAKPAPLLDGPPSAQEFPEVVFTARKSSAAPPR